MRSVEGIARIAEFGSLIPGVGAPFAVIAAAIRLGQGNYGDAALDSAALIPLGGIVGKVAKGAKVAEETIRGTTVIGHLPDYVEVAKKMGSNYLKPSTTWNWRVQGDFIKEVIKSGDNVFIGTSIRQGPSVLKREIKQLIKAGYRPVKQGSRWLVKEIK